MDSNNNIGRLEPEQHKGKVISVADLTKMCNEAAAIDGNPYSVLLLNCGYALQQLVQRIDALEQQLNPRIVQ